MAVGEVAQLRVATGRILDILGSMYPDARCALDFTTPFELLVATILSAQCTDERVNMITPRLFPRYPTPAAMLALSQEDLEDLIHDCGLFRSKARNILGTCDALQTGHSGEVPRTMAALLKLPGVGRKTANVVLSNAFGVPAIAVDTHVFRVARRLGLAHGETPEQVERDLRLRIPRRDWSAAHHWLIHHGRQICHARRPDCLHCPLSPYCPAYRLGQVHPK
ncbi:MAG: endonuclease III [Thermaerobacter sp.]|nr:endonuclease III [Thermaerobacter sp.]